MGTSYQPILAAHCIRVLWYSRNIDAPSRAHVRSSLHYWCAVARQFKSN
jgi:hypothetical protein